MALAIPSHMHMQVDSQPRRKRKKTKEKKIRACRPCGDGVFVQVFCSWGCGVCYKTLPKENDQKAWAKTLRKLNAHESQRCPCNPNATRVSCKAKAKKKAVVDELMLDWETALLKNHVEILQQQIRFLRALPPATAVSGPNLDVHKQIDLLQGSLEHTKEFIATITSDEKVREANKLKAAKLAEDERARILKAASRALTETESMDLGVGHVWTEPTFQDQDEWQKELDMVIEMEKEECVARLNQNDSDAVGVFWSEPTEDSPAERLATLETVINEEEAERELRMTDPEHPHDPAVGVFWGQEMVGEDVKKTAAYARTAKLEAAERALRLSESQSVPCHTALHRQLTRLKAIWPQFTKALRQRFPERAVQSLRTPQCNSCSNRGFIRPEVKIEMSATSAPVVPILPLSHPRQLSHIQAPPRQRPTVHQLPVRHIPHVPQMHARFPSKRRRDFVPAYNAVRTKTRRMDSRLDPRASPREPIAPLPLDVSFSEINPLDALGEIPDGTGPVSPPSSFTDNDEFLNALDELLEMDTSLFRP